MTLQPPDLPEGVRLVELAVHFETPGSEKDLEEFRARLAPIAITDTGVDVDVLPSEGGTSRFFFMIRALHVDRSLHWSAHALPVPSRLPDGAIESSQRVGFAEGVLAEAMAPLAGAESEIIVRARFEFAEEKYKSLLVPFDLLPGAPVDGTVIGMTVERPPGNGKNTATCELRSSKIHLRLQRSATERFEGEWIDRLTQFALAEARDYVRPAPRDT